jgi:plasmid stabilization system protein ParE
MKFEVRFSVAADEDLARLFDFMLDRSQTIEDLDHAQDAVEAIRHAALNLLAATPYSFRKAGKSPTRRELIVPFGAAGYVVLYEIVMPSTIIVLAIRHQREEDYH